MTPIVAYIHDYLRMSRMIYITQKKTHAENKEDKKFCFKIPNSILSAIRVLPCSLDSVSF